jgi:hypothetical protein
MEVNVNALTGIRFASQIEAAAKAHGVDPRLLAAVAAQETGGPGSSSGANIVGDHGHGRGVFQIDDRWHAFARTAGAMDPAKNADYAAGMISGLLGQYRGNVKEALSAYNAGSPGATGTVTEWADGKRLGYADSVLRHYADLGGDPAALGADLAANRAEATPAASALAGLASATTGASSAALTSPPAAPSAASAAAPQYPAFQITLPQPAPYPTQFRPYTSVAGLDSNGPQQIDGMMTGLIDGADGLASLPDGG